MAKFHFTISYPAFIECLRIRLLLRHRKKRYGYAFRLIPLTQGQYAIVAPEDYERLNEHKWYAIKGKHTYYANRLVKKDGKAKHHPMHREILNAPDDRFVDHENREGLDNRKVNLRLATHAQNNYNSFRGFNKGTSKYRGVSFDKKAKKWRAVIYYKNQKIHLGMFETEKAAADAYDKAATKYHGEFALRNCDVFKSDKLSNI